MWWEPPAGATPDGGVVPAGVVVSLLGTGCCRARKGWCVTHQDFLLEYVPAECMLLVPRHSLLAGRVCRT